MRSKSLIYFVLGLMLSFSILSFSRAAQANRVIEIEEFYQGKIREILETRFPSKPFSVSLTVDTGRRELTRREALPTDKQQGPNLPFWFEDSEEKEIWDRMDVPLGTLIQQVRSVAISIKLDASLSKEEVAEIQAAITQNLRLDPAVDKVEILQMSWTDQEKFRDWKILSGLFAIAFLLIAIYSFIVAKVSIGALIKGLSKPIADIGQSTKRFASSALGMASEASVGKKSGADQSSGLDGEHLVDINLHEIRQNALELLERNMSLFKEPDAEFLEFLERKGNIDPAAVGSVLAELEQSVLVSLFRYGQGEWWYKAIAHPTPLTAKSLSVIGQVDRLRVRRHFSEKSDPNASTSEAKEFSLVLGRLNFEQVKECFKGVGIEKAFAMLRLLPSERCLAHAKKLFPGQWGAFLNKDYEPEPLDTKLMKEVLQMALWQKPLRVDTDIQEFFKDLDLVDYLDLASPRDEEEFYVALPKESRILQNRYPFFKLIEGDKKVLSTVAGQFSPKDWACAVLTCDASDRRALLEKVPDKMRFQIVGILKELQASGENFDSQIRFSRRSIVDAYQAEEQRAKILAGLEAETPTEISSEKTSEEDPDIERPAA